MELFVIWISDGGGWGILVLITYTVLFALILTFFEMRLNILHRKYVDKVWPIGQEGLEFGNRKFRIIVRLLFLALYLISAVLILSIL